MRAFLTASALVLCLTACQTTFATSEGCEWTRTITVSHKDVLTGETAAEIEEHNRARSEICNP